MILLDIIKKFLSLIKVSVEGQDGKASGRRMSALVITTVCYVWGRVSFVLYVISMGVVFVHSTVYSKDLHENLVATFKWLLLGHCLDIIFIGLLWGYINFAQVVELRNGGKKTNSSKEEQKNL